MPRHDRRCAGFGHRRTSWGKPAHTLSCGGVLRVSDCADAVFAVIEKGKINEIYNVGSGQEKRNIDVVKIVLNILGKPEELIEFVKDRLGHDFRYSLNGDKIERELGWKAKVEFDEGIDKTVSWYLNNMGWIENKMAIIREYWKKAY